PLPFARIRAGLPGAVRALRGDGLGAAARAIMPTDTVPKIAALHTRIDGRRVTLAGIAKGAGMIEPNLATMLSFLVTDAAVAPPLLRRLLAEACRQSFNRLTVDRETPASHPAPILAHRRPRPAP